MTPRYVSQRRVWLCTQGTVLASFKLSCIFFDYLNIFAKLFQPVGRFKPEDLVTLLFLIPICQIKFNSTTVQCILICNNNKCKMSNIDSLKVSTCFQYCINFSEPWKKTQDWPILHILIYNTGLDTILQVTDSRNILWSKFVSVNYSWGPR